MGLFAQKKMQITQKKSMRMKPSILIALWLMGIKTFADFSDELFFFPKLVKVKNLEIFIIIYDRIVLIDCSNKGVDVDNRMIYDGSTESGQIQARLNQTSANVLPYLLNWR